jgi:hypothetical protein
MQLHRLHRDRPLITQAADTEMSSLIADLGLASADKVEL